VQEVDEPLEREPLLGAVMRPERTELAIRGDDPEEILKPAPGVVERVALDVEEDVALLCQAGETGRSFTLQTEALPPGDPERAEQVRAVSRARIGVERERVEARLARRGRRRRAA
jgi:hypothetical protein